MEEQPVEDQLRDQLQQLKDQLEEQREEELDAGLEHKGRIVYQIQESRSGKVHQAVCAELLITAFGDSPEEARESLRTQVAQYLEDCDALGSLDEVLIEAGFYFDGDAWVSNEVTPVKDPNINIIF